MIVKVIYKEGEIKQKGDQVFPLEFSMWHGVTKLNHCFSGTENEPGGAGEVRHYRLNGNDMSDNVIFDIELYPGDVAYICNDQGKTIEIVRG